MASSRGYQRISTTDPDLEDDFSHDQPSRPTISRSSSWAMRTAASVDEHTHWHRERRQTAGLYVTPSIGGNGYAPIALEDHELDHADESGALWAREVMIDDWVVVGGNAVGGSYVVWNCTVETLDGGPIKLMKRYSEFEKLRQRLARTFPNSDAAMPQLPPKSLISKFNEKFLEKRRAGLSYFLNCILLNPEFAGSPVLKEFLFS